MKQKKIIKLNLTISVVGFITLLLVSLYLDINLNKSIPNIIEYKKIDSTGLSFTKLNELKDKYKEANFTGYSEAICKVRNKFDITPKKAEKTKLVLTDENFFTLYNYKFISGGKIDYLSVEKGDKIIVISDVLAVKLYKTLKVVGNEIEIDNATYKIIGVYKQDKSFIFNMSDDGYDRIFVPYTSYIADNMGKLTVDVFATNESRQNTSAKIRNKLVNILGGALSQYNSYSYILNKNINFQYLRILCFLIGLWLIVELIRILKKYVKSLALIFKENSKKYYVKDIISSNKIQLLTILSKISLILVCIIVIFMLAKFTVIIDPNYLPSDNVFDLKFYKDTIVKYAQLTNANEVGYSNVYNRYVTNINSAERSLLIGEIIFFAIALINIKGLRSMSTSELKGLE
ncbi:ABC transporter permease [Clostridium manihotivorum]|uniref:MacB-like periplasmic core domain-containing protein n=1 Tax=Clostridium manihotivorum TaxID=2320868 RepID=A0A410DTF4_9CLOT|nr:ABC transporter permease [Clostridium manihotivorum]QAA32321.1 hypothetical protein C1I91_12110 [Clostridium manihotivorum]